MPRLLVVDGVSSGHEGGTHLHAVSLIVAAGSIHAVVGHNGAGKSTLLHTIAGLIRPQAGRILLDGKELTRVAAHRRSHSGIGYVPQGARVFASLTVAEHLAIGHRRRAQGNRPEWTAHRVFELLPQLAARIRHRGAQLSGGEQQMLAIARALLTQPRLLLLDEPTEGLSPAVSEQIHRTITTLAGERIGILLATPHPAVALTLANDISVLTTGRLTKENFDDEYRVRVQQQRAGSPGSARKLGNPA